MQNFFIGIAFAFIWAFPTSADERPITGTSVKDFKPLEKSIMKFMDKINCQAGAVAVSYKGQLVYSRGFGWQDKERKKATPPTALFRLASVSKPITAALIRLLFRQKLLRPDTRVFPLLALQPGIKGKKVDPRLKTITVEHLLRHKGGWDKKKSFDPMFQVKKIKNELKLDREAIAEDIVRYMITKPLQFTPGERYAYSNFGYCVLGRVIEKKTGQTYHEAVQKLLCQPLKIKDIRLGRTKKEERDPREVWYPVPEKMLSMEIMDAHGGLIASAPALCKFMDHYLISGRPRSPGHPKGSFAFIGSLPGTTSMVLQRHDGRNIAVLLNNRRFLVFDQDNERLLKSVEEAMDKIVKQQK